MFVLSGAFSGIEKIVARRRDERKIGFGNKKEDEAKKREDDYTELSQLDQRLYELTKDKDTFITIDPVGG